MLNMADSLAFGGLGYRRQARAQLLCDSYGSGNKDSSLSLYSASFTSTGQSFTARGTLSSCQFYVNKSGSPTGFAYAKIYAHTGVFGTSSVPTGTAIAVSDPLDVSTLTSTFVMKNFTFQGGNRVTFANGARYVAAVEYGSGNASNLVNAGVDSSAPSHAGNYSTLSGSAWTAHSSGDLCFGVQTIL